MRVKITKIWEVPNLDTPSETKVGFTRTLNISLEKFNRPKIGHPFYVGKTDQTNANSWTGVSQFFTGNVEEVLSKDVFRTRSSIYQWEVVEF